LQSSFRPRTRRGTPRHCYGLLLLAVPTAGRLFVDSVHFLPRTPPLNEFDFALDLFRRFGITLSDRLVLQRFGAHRVVVHDNSCAARAGAGGRRAGCKGRAGLCVGAVHRIGESWRRENFDLHNCSELNCHGRDGVTPGKILQIVDARSVAFCGAILWERKSRGGREPLSPCW